MVIFGLAIYPYQVSNNTNMNNTQISNGIELVYGNEAVEWMIDNSQKKPDFDRIIESYRNICNTGTQMNIYDKNQGIIVTIEVQNNSYLISNIIDDITEIK